MSTYKKCLLATNVLPLNPDSSVYKYTYENDRLVEETDYEGRVTKYSEFDEDNEAQYVSTEIDDVQKLVVRTLNDEENTVFYLTGLAKTSSWEKTETVYDAEVYSGKMQKASDYDCIDAMIELGDYAVRNIRKQGEERENEILKVYDENNLLLNEFYITQNNEGKKEIRSRKRYTYNENDLKKTMVVFFKNEIVFGLQYEYGANGLAAIYEISNGNALTEAQLQTATPLETYSYNSRGLLDKEVIHITGADTGGNIETRYSYNIGGLKTQQLTIKNAQGHSPMTISYAGYNNDGKVKYSGETQSSSYHTLYEYDAFGELKKETTGSRVTEFRFDEKYNIGARLETTTGTSQATYWTYNTANSGDMMNRATKTYVPGNGPDKTTRYDITFDEFGNETSCGIMEAIQYDTRYNGEAQLIEANPGSAAPYKYVYDSDGMLVYRKRETNGQEGTPAYSLIETTEYVYDENGELILTIDTNNSKMIKYVRGINGQIIKQESASLSGSFGGTYYYAYNIHGDVNRLFDENGTVVATYVYDSYGMLKGSTGSMADENPFRYCGEYYDEHTQCIYLRARFYNPITMRFKQADTYLGDVGDPSSRNLYAYCGNDPVNYNDPTGHWGSKIHKEVTKSVLDNNLDFYSIGSYDPASKKYNKLMSKKFYNWIVKGCTYPDKFRFRDEDKNGKADKKSKLFGGMVFHDANDTTKGYWHGGKGYELKGKNLTKEIKKAAKFFNNEKYKKAGIYLGCIFHAVQDIEAHQYNEYIKNTTNEKSFKNFISSKNIQNNLARLWSSSDVKEYIDDYVKKEDGKIVPTQSAYKNKGKAFHRILADNPYVYKKGDNWKFIKSNKNGITDYNDNPRIQNSKKRTRQVLKRFVNKVL